MKKHAEVIYDGINPNKEYEDIINRVINDSYQGCE